MFGVELASFSYFLPYSNLPLSITHPGDNLFLKHFTWSDHQTSYLSYTYREDRRRGYIGNDYGEQDDEIDYSKKFDDEEPILLVS